MTSCQQFIDDAGQCEHIVPWIRVQTIDHLRTGVGGSHRPQRLHIKRCQFTRQLIGVRYRSRNPEVDDLDPPIREHDDIRRLQVGVDDTFAVSELQRGHNLPEYRQHACERRTLQPVLLQDRIK